MDEKITKTQMTPAQMKRAKALILKDCANCVGGNCIKLESDLPCPCPQLMTNTVLCHYFVGSVLPDNDLYAELLQVAAPGSTKLCEMCGKPFKANTTAQKYCDDCKTKAARIKARDRKRRQRTV